VNGEGKREMGNGIGERRKGWIYLFIFNNNLERKFVGDVSY